jgi:hypothetical protein
MGKKLPLPPVIYGKKITIAVELNTRGWLNRIIQIPGRQPVPLGLSASCWRYLKIGSSFCGDI